MGTVTDLEAVLESENVRSRYLNGVLNALLVVKCEYCEENYAKSLVCAGNYITVSHV
jgi:hypothetical protein